MAVLFALEDFNSPAPKPRITPVAELPGYEAGYDAALADTAAQQTRLSDDTLQALNGLTFGFAEAHQHLTAALEPLFHRLIDQLLPEILPKSFRGDLVATLMEAAEKDLSAPFALQLHPAQIAAVSNVIPDTLARRITLSANPGLTRNAALISRASVETMLDHDAMLAKITTALSALFDKTPESKSHG